MTASADALPQRSLICARCGTAFGCNRDGACWCMDEAYRLPMPVEGSGDDCLCPDCLRAMAQIVSG